MKEEKKPDRRNGVYVNDPERVFQVHLFDDGSGDAIAKCLGSLEMAKDIVKQKISEWRMKDIQRKGILVPNGNGKPPSDVV